jgi:hypothetical protein
MRYEKNLGHLSQPVSEEAKKRCFDLGKALLLKLSLR